MANFVAKTLYIRPSEILDGWGTPELIVTYGHFANEMVHKNYEEWKSLDSKERVKYPRPPEYAVKFLGVI